MKKQHYQLIICALCIFIFTDTKAQMFITLDSKISIPDHGPYTDDRDKDLSNVVFYQPLVVPIHVEGLPMALNTNFGLEQVAISIQHNRVSDLKVELISPDGTLVWLTNRNGKNGKDYANTRFSQTGFRGPISSATTPFDGDYQPDGNLANVNNGQNPNGVWLLKVHDLAENTEGVFEKIVLRFGEQPALLKVSPCSVDNPLGCCSSRVDGRMLPDLVVSENGTSANVWEVAYDEKKGYGTLMFEVRAMNLGEGPLELEGTDTWLCGKDTVKSRHFLCKTDSLMKDSTYPRQIFRQNIFKLQDGNLEKTSRFAGTMAYDAHPGHDHFHADYYARFSFLKPDDRNPNDTTRWRIVGKSHKSSFCLWDMQFCDEENGKCDYNSQIYSEKNLPNFGFGNYQTCDDPHRQGISVGGIDWYGLHYDGQNLRLPKGTTNGLYFLKIELDPYDFYEEADETNNVLILPVFLRMQKSPYTIEKIEEVEEINAKSIKQ